MKCKECGGQVVNDVCKGCGFPTKKTTADKVPPKEPTAEEKMASQKAWEKEQAARDAVTKKNLGM